MIALFIPSALLMVALSAQAETYNMTVVIDDPAEWAGLQVVVAQRNAEIEERNAALPPPCAEQPPPNPDDPNSEPCVEPPDPEPLYTEESYLQRGADGVLVSYAQQTGMDSITSLQAEKTLEADGLGDAYRVWLASPDRTPEELAISDYSNWNWYDPVVQKVGKDLGLSEDELWSMFETARGASSGKTKSGEPVKLTR